jgi:hypothetical protein
MIFKHRIEKQNKQTTSSTCREIKKSNSNLINTYRKIEKENKYDSRFLFVFLCAFDFVGYYFTFGFVFFCLSMYRSNSDSEFAELSTYLLGIVWLPLFGAEIKEFIYDSNNYLFGCHGIGYGIYFMPNLNTYWVPCHLYRFAKMK